MLPRTVLPRTPATLLSLTCALALAGCAGAPSEGGDGSSSDASAGPITYTSCGQERTLDEAPTAAVTLNQGATEVMLALGLEDRMAGTAYIDDGVSSRWQEAYDSVPVLAEEYPSLEQLLSVEPDLAYASYGSAFADDGVASEDELEQDGIGTYLSPFGCSDDAERPETTFENVWSEIETVGSIFGVEDTATELVDGQRQQLDEVREQASGEGMDILWYDSGDDTPFVGAGEGGPQLLIDAVGGTNIFADLEGGWADGSWEDVVDAEPDVIVVPDAAWSSAEEKVEHLESDPVLSELDAVQQDRIVEITYSQATPGATMVEGAQSLSDGLAELDAS